MYEPDVLYYLLAPLRYEYQLNGLLLLLRAWRLNQSVVQLHVYVSGQYCIVTLTKENLYCVCTH